MRMLSSGTDSLREDDIPPDQSVSFQRIRLLPFLIHDLDGKYSFAHKSFLEFFAARLISIQIREQNASVLEHVLLSREVVEFVAGLDVPIRVLEGWLAALPGAVLNRTIFLENVQLCVWQCVRHRRADYLGFEFVNCACLRSSALKRLYSDFMTARG